MSKTVQHEGVVRKIENNTIYVSIIAKAACVGCHARNMCEISDMEEKIIEVQKNNRDFEVGQKVNVFLEEKQGYQALFLGYILPLILVVVSLIVASLFFSEIVAGFLSIFVLIPYYVILYLAKKKKYNFRVEEIRS